MVPFGKVTVTVEPGSAVPVIGSTALIGSMSGAFGAIVSIVTVPVSVPTLPAKSVAVTVTLCGPSPNTGNTLSGRVHVPSPLFTAGKSTPSTFTTIVAFGSLIVPLKSGVESLVNSSFNATTGGKPSPSTISVPGNETFPAKSVAVAVTVSPSTRLPGFGTVHVPVTGSVGT